MSLNRKIRTGLFVDFDNIFLRRDHDDVARLGKLFVDNVSNWLLWLEDGALTPGQGRGRDIVIRNVYWNAQFERFKPKFEAAGFNTQTCTAAAARKIDSMKSSADIWITMDAIDASLRRSRNASRERSRAGSFRGFQDTSLRKLRLDEIIILTRDTDFIPVVNRLQLRNLRVVTAGDERDRSFGMYGTSADAVISMNALKQACSYVRKPRGFFGFKRRVVEVAPPETGRLSSGEQLVSAHGDVDRSAPTVRQAELPQKSIASVQPVDSVQVGAVSQQRRGRKIKRGYDLQVIGKAVEAVGIRTPRQPIPDATIVRIFSQFPDFVVEQSKDQDAWFGYDSYDAVLEALAKTREHLAIMGSRRSRTIMYVGPVEPSEDAG